MNKPKIFEYDKNSISSMSNMGTLQNKYTEMTHSQQFPTQAANRPSITNKIYEQNRQSLVHQPQTYISTSSQNGNIIADYMKDKHSIYNEQSSFRFSTNTNKIDQSQELDLSQILMRLSQREQNEILNKNINKPQTYVAQTQSKNDYQQKKQQINTSKSPERSRSREQAQIFGSNKQIDQLLEQQKRNLSLSLQRQPQKNIQIDDLKSNQNFVTSQIVDNKFKIKVDQIQMNQTQQSFQRKNDQKIYQQQSFQSLSPTREEQRSRQQKLFQQQSIIDGKNVSHTQYIQQQLHNQGLRTSVSPVKMDQSQVSQVSRPSRKQQNELSMMVENSSMLVINHGFKGLPNIGNSCFMNSVLQCLFNLPKFNDYFSLNTQFQKSLSKNHTGISLNYRDVLIQIKNFETRQQSKTLPNTQDLRLSIEKYNKQFSNFKQQDAQEFLRVLLYAIHDDLNKATQKQKYKQLKADLTKLSFSKISNDWWNYFRESDNSIVTDIFQGQLLNKVQCNVCNFQSVAFDNFLDISLSFAPNQKDINIYNLIEQYFNEEILQDQSKCPKCKLMIKPIRKFFLWRLPDVLVIHLKRYSYQKDLNQPSVLRGQQKLMYKIRFPLQNLDLTKYVKESTHLSTLNCFYDLCGVVHHNGTLLGGHYSADCMSFQDYKWYHINDTQVKQIDISRQPYLRDGSDSPYLLFYTKNSKKR